MSADEELTAKGRLVTEYADAKKLVALLRQEVERVADTFLSVGKALKDQSENVAIKGQAMSLTRPKRIDIADDWPDQAKLSSLLNDLREAIDRLQDLEQKMRDIGAL